MSMIADRGHTACDIIPDPHKTLDIDFAMRPADDRDRTLVLAHLAARRLPPPPWAEPSESTPQVQEQLEALRADLDQIADVVLDMRDRSRTPRPRRKAVRS